jgi:hypothetical protein
MTKVQQELLPNDDKLIKQCLLICNNKLLFPPLHPFNVDLACLEKYPNQHLAIMPC